MLSQIHIQNFSIVESLCLDFTDGLSVLTGETGAGKSIWIDAIELALGQRAHPKMIRQDEKYASITLSFTLNDIPIAKQWLIRHQFDNQDECLIRRVIHRDGPSRNSINGHPCPLQLLREFAQIVLHIHSQHQHQALLKTDTQRKALDAFADNKDILMEIQQVYQQWKTTSQKLETLFEQSKNREAESKLLRYQLQEFEHLSLSEGEWHKLSTQHQQLHNAKDLITQLSQAIDLTVENEQASAAKLLQQALDQLAEIKLQDPQIISAKELLQTASIHLQEAGNELHHYRNHLDLSPEHLSHIEDRLTAIYDLARKHHVNPENLADVEKSTRQKLSDMDNLETYITTLKQAQTLFVKQYNKLATNLSERRQMSAQNLNQYMTDYLAQLGIEGGRFAIQFEPIEQDIHPYGSERVLFTVSTNPGQAFQPLNQVVSGGELSRISLALQVITAKKGNTPTLIFDEVDVGIGGKTAEIVGRLLRDLGERVQVLCITHLPQVAAQGHHHYKADKITQRSQTRTQITILNIEQRIDELSRMLGGATITSQTRAHASEMLQQLQGS